jgi:hypothetical protein
MSQGSRARDLYFRKYIEDTPTAEAYMEALKNSPYRKHKRIAIALRPQYETIKALKEKESAIENTENTDDLQAGGNNDNG